MTVREVLVMACKLIYQKEIAEKIENKQELTQDEQDFVNQLVTMVNLVQDEICTEFIPLIIQEDIQSEHGEKSILSLSKSLAYILSLKDSSGVNVKYKIRGDKIVFEGMAKIEYCYIPNMVGIDDEFDFVLPARVFAYGVVREYYLSKDMPSEASENEEKFKNSLLIFSRKHSEMVMPKRCWL